MEYLNFIFYGLIQGLTEFIPVSSTAHLKIISDLFGINDPGSSLSAIIQMGSIVAIFWYFKHDLLNRNTKKSKNYQSFSSSKKLFKSIFIGTIPIVCFGGIVKLFIPEYSESFLRSNLSIGILSLLMSLLMYISESFDNKFISIKNHKYFDSLLIGIAQAFAILPGVSRSGVTISIALLSGWERKDAAKFSFLLGIPAISLAALVEFFSSISEFSTFPFFPLLVGLLTTFLSSLLAINFFVKYLSLHGLKLFAYYRLFFGILILLNL